MTVRQLEEYIKINYGPDALDYEINFRQHAEDDYWWQELQDTDIELSEESKQIMLG